MGRNSLPVISQKGFVFPILSTIFRALCQSRLPVERRKNLSRNGLRSPQAARSCVGTLHDGIYSPLETRNGSASSQKRAWWIRLTRRGLRRTCHSRNDRETFSPDRIAEWVPICIRSPLRESFLSVRGYGLRTYEPRQGRNAATVV